MAGMQPEPGRLVLAGTPIGDLADASPALRRALATAELIAAEDTRRLRRLCAVLQVKLSGRVLSFFEGNEARRIPELLDELRRGASVLVVSDAGMPAISDPGYRLVAAAVAAGIGVSCTPGPSAVLAALVVSGLPVDRFCFEGFLPRKAGERGRRLAGLAEETRTMVFFEAPHRLAAVLKAMTEVFGPMRPAVVCRELTKTHEEIRRAGLGELAGWAAAGVRGEITVIVGGCPDSQTELSTADLAAAVRHGLDRGLSRRDATAEVAVRLGVSRRAAYQAGLEQADDPS